MLLVLLVLVLFLGRWRLALIPGLAVPVALVGSLSLVKLSGSNLNSLILLAWCWPPESLWMTPSS